MFTSITWQDWESCAGDRGALLLRAIADYKISPDFCGALDASRYFAGDNVTVSRKTVLQARKIETRDADGRRHVRSAAADVVGNRIGSGFLFRFICQQNQFLLGNGCILPDEKIKAMLGSDFDHQLALLGEKALIHGVSWGFWNADHLEVLPAAVDGESGFFALLDELSGEARLGVQFFRIARDKPMYVRLFEAEGVTVLREEKSGLIPVIPRRAYVRTCRTDALGASCLGESNWPALPILPLLANSDGRSELTPAIRAKIDAYDNILSDFADNLDRANDVYWVLNNFGGTTDDIAEMLAEIQRIKAVCSLSDGTGSSSTAEPHTIEVPYAARQAALTLLEKALYDDFMALDLNALTGGSLTNVAIRAACAGLNLKCDRYEWQAFRFVQSLLRLLGVDTDEIRFQRQTIGNDSEIVADIAAMRGDIDHRTALKLNPYVQPDEIEGILAKDIPESGGLPA